MTLREQQSVFALNFAKLVIFANENGYEITHGEGWRTHDQQVLYFEGYTIIKVGSTLKLAKCTTRSKTMFSKHLKKLAHDINLFYKGRLLGSAKKDREHWKILADYWRALHPENESGYDWGWDLGHFQMN